MPQQLLLAAKSKIRETVVRQVVGRFKVPRDVVRFAMKRYDDRCALIVGNRSVSYRELNDRSLRLGSAWRKHGIVSRSVVFCLLPDSVELIEVRLAGYETGVLLTQFHIDSGIERVLLAAERITPELFLYDPEVDEACAQALLARFPQLLLWPVGPHGIYENELSQATGSRSSEPIDPRQPMGVNFSSGTTGVPKAMMAGHGKMIASMQLVLKNIRIEFGDAPDVAMAGIPLTGSGSGIVLPTLLSGGAIVIAPTYEADSMAQAVQRHKVTRLLLTPSMLIDLLDVDPARYDLSSLTNIIYGSEIMPAAKIAEAIKRFGPVLQQGYGSVEVMPPISMLQPHEHVDAHGNPLDYTRLSSAGVVIPEVGVRIVDDQQQLLPTGEIGRILVKSPTIFDHYVDQNNSNPGPSEWFALGDVGYFDSDNRLHVLGRLADVITRASGVTYPRLVEELLHDHEAVKECCMVQVGNQAVLVISPRRAFAYRVASAPDVFVAEIRSLLVRQVPPKDLPDEIVVVADLPRSILAKVVRREVRESLLAGTLRTIHAPTIDPVSSPPDLSAVLHEHH
jgi:fatty-acyl-CoA synthase